MNKSSGLSKCQVVTDVCATFNAASSRGAQAA